ncbi:Ig-like domain-containing protein [Agromyces aerolatus]|uniref:Ig-like domain-containing protein n=1 Tax=Agromyces sp. LY-1074 TaxID=3074080 RepID=UPI002855D3DE|nr:MULTISPECIES: Ig-like domain-containing protein [unclassified Agromyces]MDR5701306.1 Ig-like domain-containing protein [Agromyces sp. LY-1074]MDR5707564.1 Ig-like domain-containing protein [Agromyces sp. LY-1358]
MSAARGLDRRRSVAATSAVVAVVLALVAGVAIASGGYRAEQVDLGDGSVWVANDRRQSVGRANTVVHELNAVVETGANRVELTQRGSTVLALDRSNANVSILDPVTSTLIDTVAVPPQSPVIAMAGSRVVVAADGQVWTTPAEEFAAFDADAEPALEFGAGTIVSVDDDGILFAYTPTTGAIARVDAAAEVTVSERWAIPPAEGPGTPQLTSVGGRWAVLDPELGTLRTEDREIDLGGVLGDVDGAVLQSPSTTGTTAAVATRSGLFVVPLDGAQPRAAVDGRSGVPARPVVHDGCLNAAWSDGTAWRSCDERDDEGVLVTLEGASGSTGVVFRANGDALVLNDPRSGRSWAASDDFGLIDNWDALLADPREDERIERNDPATPPTLEKAQAPPVAADDTLGARAGRATILPVLLNDYDPNGDVMVVERIDGALPDGAAIDLVSDRQQVQLTLEGDVGGVLTFGYTISDGRGGTASARVVVEVREPDENGPPMQMRSTGAAVASGGRVSVPVLGEWIDPDGDPFFLRTAGASETAAVSATADGVVVVDEQGGPAGTRTIGLAVSDGRDEGSGVLEVDVRSPGDVPLVAEPFVALATSGEEVRLEPLRHVTGGNGDVRLTAVPAKPDAQLVADFDGGSFRFQSQAVRTHYLEYTVTDGTQTATGQVRVEVHAPPERDTTPITVPHTAFVRAQHPVELDVLATDIDPRGGVLLISGLTRDASELGVRVEVVEHRMLRVTLTRPLELGSTEVRYRASNGLADAEGVVTVVEVPAPATAQPPVAAPDRASARTGDVVDLAVLENDEHPDGDALTLAADLVSGPERGLMFASGDRLRFFAPEEPGVYRAVYRVEAPDGQFATATAEVSVRGVDPETNAAPVPATVTARAIAGETIRIPVPLGGTDPDGDSVQLLGEESAPELGLVSDRGVDWLEYHAGDYSAGTDTFRYAVVDALGAKSTGSVRVGIAPRLEGARMPVAAPDEVIVRPGRTIEVRVLANDSDPDGGALSILDVEPIAGDAAAEVDGDVIRVTVPDAEGTYGFLYSIQNEQLATAGSYVTIEARTDAPLARPEAADTMLSLSDIADRDRVDVDVLEHVFIADAPVSRATVDLVPGFGDAARVRADGRIRVEVGDRRRIVPFTVGHPDDPSLTATALIWVPGRADAAPQLRSDAPRVRVDSGDEVELELADFVIAASGRPVRITDVASVRASNSDGSGLVVDADTLRFRSAPGYFGPASLSFVVTDGESADDPSGRTGTIVIPIEVRAMAGQPPSFTGGVVDFEPGLSRRIDLTRLTSTPQSDAEPRLSFDMGDVPDGFRAELRGHDLAIQAEDGVALGQRSALVIEVADGDTEGTPGIIELRVVPSTRPLASPAPDQAIAARGQTTRVDVLANDQAGNPFPGTPLRVVGVRGVDDRSLPSGLRVVPSDDRSTLAVTVAPNADPVNTTVQYQVADATGDPSRFTWGTVAISVQDRPSPVTDPRVTGFGDGSIDLAFGAGVANNSAVSGYEVTLVDADDGGVVGGTTCAATTCTVRTPGNGQDDAVRVRIQARNAIGLSDPVEVAGSVWSDVVPPPPSGLDARPLDGGLRLQWQPVGTVSGSSVRAYVVEVGGVSTEVAAGAACTPTTCTFETHGLANGSRVPVAVSARNEAYPALAMWTQATGTGTPFGAPIAGMIQVTGDAATGTVTVSWSPFGGNGDAVAGYFVQRLVPDDANVPGGPQACQVTAPAPGQVVPPANGGNVAATIGTGPETTSVQFGDAMGEGTRYSFIVWGYNRSGCAHTEVAGTVVRPAPAPAPGTDPAPVVMPAFVRAAAVQRAQATAHPFGELDRLAVTGCIACAGFRDR